MIYDKDERPLEVAVPDGIEFHKVMLYEINSEPLIDRYIMLQLVYSINGC